MRYVILYNGAQFFGTYAKEMSVAEGAAGMQQILASPDLKTVSFDLDNGGKVIFPLEAIQKAVVVIEADPVEVVEPPVPPEL